MQNGVSETTTRYRSNLPISRLSRKPISVRWAQRIQQGQPEGMINPAICIDFKG
jgi:hypothetical protein